MIGLSGTEIVSVVVVGLLVTVMLWVMTSPGEVTDVSHDTVTTSTVGTTVTPHQVDIHTFDRCSPR